MVHGDIEIKRFPGPVTRYVVWAASVRKRSSSRDVIYRIGQELGQFAKENPWVQIIESPILGGAAGGLDLHLAGSALREGFLSICSCDAVLIIFSQAATVIRSLRGMRYSCFISYATRDQNFANRLHADQERNGVRCWFAPHDVRGGQKLHQQIDEAIGIHDRVLLILSEHSMNSEWVKTEIAKARKREMKEQKRVLFPVRLVEFASLRDWECFDADSGKDSAREIREYFIPDFRDWNDDTSYRAALSRLLDDLKNDASTV